MTKTRQTISLENSLEDRSRKKREYGCTEVTIGFAYQKHGDEIVDYMSMDAHRVFRCYEIKVTLADLKTDNRKSWYGDYNYLVVSQSLWMRNVEWDNYIPPYVGILVGEQLDSKRNAKKKNISDEDRQMLEDSLLRSVYWKMSQYKDAQDLEQLKQLRKQLEEVQENFETYRQKVDALIFDSEDYEEYYRKNHQSEQFSISSQAKQERLEYFNRIKGKMTWKTDLCPVCHKEALKDGSGNHIYTDFCPFCGVDLRKL